MSSGSSNSIPSYNSNCISVGVLQSLVPMNITATATSTSTASLLSSPLCCPLFCFQHHHRHQQKNIMTTSQHQVLQQPLVLPHSIFDCNLNTENRDEYGNGDDDNIDVVMDVDE